MKIDSFPLTKLELTKKKPVKVSKDFQAQLSTDTLNAPSAPLALTEDSWWTFQEFISFAAEEPSLYQKGETMLKLLNALRIDLLNGNIPYSRIQTLNDFLQSLPENQHSSLQEIIDDIILRVEIELAKIEKLS